MTIHQIPLSPNIPLFDQHTILDGVTYTMRFCWNERDQKWFFTLGDDEEDPIIAGKKLVADWPLLHRVRDDRRPPGQLLVLDLSGQGHDPMLEDLGKRVILVYLDAAELGIEV